MIMRKLYMVLVAAVVIAVATGCEKEYDLRRVDDVLVEALNSMFPKGWMNI
jgi:hypothetical protein